MSPSPTSQTLSSAARPTTARGSVTHAPGSPSLAALSIGALGIVYGDIGTSPLYAIKECFNPAMGIAPTLANVYGILSLVFWSLVLVVSVKYLIFILRADNEGEGGIMALLALVLPKLEERKNSRSNLLIVLLGIFGASLLYGDGIITPAISVLSAIEGLEVATPAFKPMVVPLTVIILVALFSVQSRGTAKIGAIFGPVCLVWFVTLAAVAIPWILKRPEILSATNPMHALTFFATNGITGYLILGAVILCVTGAEALYADMGHFGKAPIRIGWFAIVLPALVINYFGQGALILDQGAEALANPFYGLVSGWVRYPLVAIATAATVIASQALISGAFSLTQQAVQLGYLPRIKILHTSRSTEGQIYVPRVNTILMIGCLALVLGFQSTSNLAHAYGVATTGAMVITAILFYVLSTRVWKWPKSISAVLLGVFLIVDLAFVGANLNKISSGGWFPILIAMMMLALMTTWKRGREVLGRRMMALARPLDVFFEEVRRTNPPRVKGTAVFMTLNRDIAPSVLLHHFKHNKTLHEKVILLSIITEHVPEIPSLQHVRVTELEEGFVKVVARYGYVQTPDITEILALCEGSGLPIDYKNLSFYLGRETFVTTGESGMAGWRKRLFVLLSRNARPATEFFKLPPDQVIEIGSQISL